MMLCVAVYVDNLERTRYDVALAIENWKGIPVFVFTGGDATYNMLAKLSNGNVSVIKMGKRIKVPSDIPVAYNSVINYCYDVIGMDALVTSFADVYVTEKGVSRFVEWYEKGLTVSIDLMTVQLYTELWPQSYCILSRHDDRVYYDERADGMMLSRIPEHHIKSAENGDYTLALDMGYFTISHYVNRMIGHNKIWPDEFKTRVVHAFNSDINTGLRIAYNKIREVKGRGLTSIDTSYYGMLLDKFNTWEEYNHCLEIMKEFA